MSKEILFLNPVFTHNIWGGTKLREEYGYDIQGDDIAQNFPDSVVVFLPQEYGKKCTSSHSDKCTESR